MGGRTWKPLGAVCRPVVTELWGHGRSPAGESPEDYSAAGYLRQFEAIRERLAAERWYLCGQSLGASLTLRYSLAFPERVIAQVFTNSNSAFATAEIIVERQRLAKAAIEDIEARGLAAVEDLPVHPRRARRLPPDLHREMVADTCRIDPRAIADSYRHLNVDVSVREAARTISVPTMMVCGSYEKRFAPHRDYAQANVPGLCVVDLPAGHAVNAERHEEFNAAVAAFLRTVRETGRTGGAGDPCGSGWWSRGGTGPRIARSEWIDPRPIFPVPAPRVFRGQGPTT